MRLRRGGVWVEAGDDVAGVEGAGPILCVCVCVECELGVDVDSKQSLKPPIPPRSRTQHTYTHPPTQPLAYTHAIHMHIHTAPVAVRRADLQLVRARVVAVAEEGVGRDGPRHGQLVGGAEGDAVVWWVRVG